MKLRLLTATAVVFVTSLTTLTTQTASAQDSAGPSASGSFDVETLTPNVKPSLQISRTTGPVKIDGDMNEAAWRQAGVATNFSETFPKEQAEPPIGIDVFAMYDDDNLYLSYIIFDDPSQIRANLSDRDQIWQDDYVGILLDPNGDGATTYFIASNALGIQGDTRISRNDEDVSFDLIYQSAARITESGYQVEFAIPFRSLRFPAADAQQWNATFWITHPRDSRNTYSWAAIDRDDPCFSCQMGTLDGLAGVRSGRNLEILPSVTGSQSAGLIDGGDPGSGFDNGKVDATPSVNIKYGITSDLTADVTVNPDFSQIEADAAQIDVNSAFALFFPERRPFFQEGADLFDTFVSTVYTRSINDPIAAGKFTGRFGQTNVAYIGGRDNRSAILLPFEEGSEIVSDAGKSFSNILRVQRNFKDNSYVGGLVTDRRFDNGGGGSTFGIDGVYRFWTKYQLEGQFVASRTAEPNSAALSASLSDGTFDGGDHTVALDGESFNGHAEYLSFERNARHWNFDVDYAGYSPTFRADNGFVTQNSNRRLTMFQGVTFYPEKIGIIDRISTGFRGATVWNFDGVKKDEWIGPSVNMQMKRQTRLFAGYWVSRELFQDVRFDGIRRFELNVFSNFTERMQAGFNVATGRSIARFLDTPELGRNLSLSGNSRIRPTQRLSLEPRISYSRLTDLETGEKLFAGYIARIRTNYQFTRRFFARTIVQYNDFAQRLEIDPLFTYRINPFTAIWVGSTHDLDTFQRTFDPTAEFFRQSSRQFFFKVQYLVRT